MITEIPVLTLMQPWATLVAEGLKHIETRGWRTKYRGPLAIHAAKGFPKWSQRLMDDGGWISDALNRDVRDLPRGKIIAVTVLENCVLAESLVNISHSELQFGDFSLGRRAWLLGTVAGIQHPIEAKGSLGLWRYRGTLPLMRQEGVPMIPGLEHWYTSGGAILP